MIIFESRTSKAVNIEVNLKFIRLVVPEGLAYRKVFLKHFSWLVEKLEAIDEARRLSRSLKIYPKTAQDFKKHVRKQVDYFSNFLKVPVKRIRLRYMKTKWGSWSSRGTLTLNLFLRFLPAKAIDYVIVHELAHYFEPEHNERFYCLLESCFPDFKDHEKLLFAYWLKLECEGIVEKVMKNYQKNLT